MVSAAALAAWLIGSLITACTAAPTPSSISADFKQINATFVEVTLTNHGPAEVIFFGQNTLFDGAIQNSVLLSHAANSNQTSVEHGKLPLTPTTQMETCKRKIILYKADLLRRKFNSLYVLGTCTGRLGASCISAFMVTTV
jgi:hypothetical protein